MKTNDYGSMEKRRTKSESSMMTYETRSRLYWDADENSVIDEDEESSSLSQESIPLLLHFSDPPKDHGKFVWSVTHSLTLHPFVESFFLSFALLR